MRPWPSRAAVVLPALLLALALLPAAVPAQGAGEGAPRVLHVHTFENQSAFEAMDLVLPLLSEHGTVELKPRENSLILRDTLAHIQRIVPVLTRFDHPKRPVRIQVRMVEARVQPFSPPAQPQVPEEMLADLKDMLPYHSYKLLHSAEIDGEESQAVQYQMSSRFKVSFQVGTVVGGNQLKLHGFKVTNGVPAAAKAEAGQELKASIERPLIHTNLNLRLDQTLYLGLAASETSKEALLVVIRVSLRDEGS